VVLNFSARLKNDDEKKVLSVHMRHRKQQPTALM